MSVISDAQFTLHAMRLMYLRNVDDPVATRIVSFDEEAMATNLRIQMTGMADPELWPELKSTYIPEPKRYSGGSEPYRTYGDHQPAGSGDRSRYGTLRAARTANSSAQDDQFKQGSSSRLDDPSSTLLRTRAGSETLLDNSRRDHSVKLRTSLNRRETIGATEGLPDSPDLYRHSQRGLMIRRDTASFLEDLQSATPDGDVQESQVGPSEHNEIVSQTLEAAGPQISLPDSTVSPEPFKLSRVVEDGEVEAVPSASETSPGFLEVDSPQQHFESQSLQYGTFETTSSNDIVQLGGAQTSPIPASRRSDQSMPKPETPSSDLPQVDQTEHMPHDSSQRFSPQAVMRQRPQKSALTLLLSRRATNDNPYSEEYGVLDGKADDAKVHLKVYCPQSDDPTNPLDVTIKGDATVEETIGLSLCTYWEENRRPRLDAGLESVEEDVRIERLRTIYWNLRITEDDGEVDEDFPALDRARGISKFSFGQFALVKATPAQTRANEEVDRRSKAQRIKDKPAPPSKASLNPSTGLARPTPQDQAGQSRRTASGKNKVVLTITWTHNGKDETSKNEVDIETYLADILADECTKRGLQASQWAFKLTNHAMAVPLDRTIRSLQGMLELQLVRRSILKGLPSQPFQTMEAGTTNPHASIFAKALVEPLHPEFIPTNEYLSAYKKYDVHRKLHMHMGRQERILAIDGDFIHIMPSDKRTTTENVKTSSFRIHDVIGCRPGNKAPTTFKIFVKRGRDPVKRYDFDAEDLKESIEICAKINHLRQLIRTSVT